MFALKSFNTLFLRTQKVNLCRIPKVIKNFQIVIYHGIRKLFNFKAIQIGTRLLLRTLRYERINCIEACCAATMYVSRIEQIQESRLINRTCSLHFIDSRYIY